MFNKKPTEIVKKKYLLYFCDDTGSVFDSQVLALLTGISEKNYFEKIYLFLGIRNKGQEVVIQKSITSSKIKTIYFRTYPNYPFFNFRTRSSIMDVFKKQGIDPNETIIHTRGEMIALHLSKIFGRKLSRFILPDIRGVSIEEISEFYNSSGIAKDFKLHNYKTSLKNIRNYSKISVVSDALKEYLICNKYVDSDSVYVTPCLAGANYNYDVSARNTIRKQLNLKPDDTLIVFSSGGTAAWQNNNMVELLAKKGYKILNLSKTEINHPFVINKYLSYTEVASYLNSADIAFIWRGSSMVNKVASPVKFSEYVCCGLPVIANYSVDMITEYIRKNNCGILVEDIDEIEEAAINRLKQMDRHKISVTAIRSFGLDAIVEKYLNIYTSFISS